MSDCEGCPPDTVEEIMAKNKIVKDENGIIENESGIIDHLVAALIAVSDELETAEGERIQELRRIHAKINAVIKYTKARI
jgi:hypothetical protein